MIDLRARPLRATHADASFYVQREKDMAMLAAALSHGFNVMILGERGAGKTTLINLLAARLEEQGQPAVQLGGSRFNTAAEALWGIARVALTEPPPSSPVPPLAAAEAMRQSISDPLEGAYRALADAAGALPENTAILVDGLIPALVHEIFGRLRDEMWTLRLQWVITGDLENKPVLLAPPADAFFDQIVTLAPFGESEIEQLLGLRDPDSELGVSVQRLIAARCEGNPARALLLARHALVAADPIAEIERGSVVERIEDELGEPAARLADDLARNGPSGPSDPQLLRRLGWSRPRAYQVFQALQHAGWTEVTAEHTGRAGRPANTFRLKEPA
ncbi:MAG TPA: ATP-binding protein [Solirubrobacteraceae bacterium]|nr:ATP-binding protein [Solirubrobacteraceae bacterium]